MSRFGAPNSRSLWEDVKYERGGFALLCVTYFSLPTGGAALSGDVRKTMITAAVALPVALLMSLLTFLFARAQQGRYGIPVARRAFAGYCLAMLVTLVGLLVLDVRYFVMEGDVAIGAFGAGLSLVAMAILWRMFNSGLATITERGQSQLRSNDRS